MDRRYFHGIRAAAADALVKHTKEEINWLGLFHLEKAFQALFCLPGSPMTRSNDFSDRAAYILQKVIPEAISRVRDNNGITPMRVKRFLYDKLKFNDNSNNEVRGPLQQHPQEITHSHALGSIRTISTWLL